MNVDNMKAYLEVRSSLAPCDLEGNVAWISQAEESPPSTGLADWLGSA